MFLLRAIQQKFRSDDNESVAFVFFNVKGRDLMAIDEANAGLSDEDKAIYTDKLDLNPTPFENVTYYYPYGKDQLTARTQSYAAPSDIKIQMTSADQSAGMNLTVEAESTIGAEAVTIPVQ